MIYPIVILAIDNEEERLFMQRLYEDYYQIMYRQARHILRGQDGADDIVSDACLALIDHIETLQSLDTYKLRAYVVSTIRNTCYNFLKKKNIRSKYVFSDGEVALMMARSDDDHADARLIREAEIEELMSALRKLPEREILLLEMKYFQQMPDSEIASMMGIKTGSVRQALSVARKHVAENIAKENSI